MHCLDDQSDPDQSSEVVEIPVWQDIDSWQEEESRARPAEQGCQLALAVAMRLPLLGPLWSTYEAVSHFAAAAPQQRDLVKCDLDETNTTKPRRKPWLGHV